MILLFTRKNTIFSRLIMWFTGEDKSHFVIHFDKFRIVLHSFRKGVEIDWYNRFKKGYTIVTRLRILNLSEHQEKELYEKIVDEYLGRDYDIGGLLFMPVFLVAKRFFNYIYPRNLWASDSNDMCTELARALQELKLLPDIAWPDSLDLMTPGELEKLLLSSRYVTKLV